MISTWGTTLAQSFDSIWGLTVSFLPNLFVALVVLVLGWVTAVVIGGWVAKLIDATKLDRLLTSVGVGDFLRHAGLKLDAGAFFGALVKWFIIILFLATSMSVLGLSSVNLFLQQVITIYIPNIFIAILILLIGAVTANFLAKLVTATAKAAGFSSRVFAHLTKWAVWLFALLAAVSQLGIAPMFFQVLFIGLISMMALAGGLAFGLGGKDLAQRWLNDTFNRE